MTIYLIGCIFLSKEGNYNLPQNKNNNIEKFPFYEICIVWISMGIIFFLWLMNANLIILHMYLIRKGISTYEWLFPPKQSIRNADNN